MPEAPVDLTTNLLLPLHGRQRNPDEGRTDIVLLLYLELAWLIGWRLHCIDDDFTRDPRTLEVGHYV